MRYLNGERKFNHFDVLGISYKSIFSKIEYCVLIIAINNKIIDLNQWRAVNFMDREAIG